MSDPAKKLEQDPAEVEPEGQYDEKLFEELDFEDGEETAEGAEGFDGEQSDESAEEQPEGKEPKAEDAEGKQPDAKDGDDAGEEGNEEGQDDEKGDGPDLPPWVEAIPEDQRDAAVTELLKQQQERINLKEAHSRLEEKYQSVRGHLAPTQRRLDRLQKMVEKFAATAEAGDDIEASKKQLLEFIEKHAEDFPLEAEQFKKAFEAYANRVEPDAKQYRKTLTQDDDEVNREEELERLEKAEPAAAQINADPRFQAFLKQNPEYQQQAKSPFAHDALDVLDAFCKSTGWAPPRRSEDFLNVKQMLVSDLLPGWAHAIGLSAEQIAQMDDVSKAKVFHHFKKDLDAAYESDSDDASDDDDEKADAGSDGDEEALRLAKQRRQRKQDRSPKAKKTGADGGLSNLDGEALFEALDVGD